jgi:hypothetical protein
MLDRCASLTESTAGLVLQHPQIHFSPDGHGSVSSSDIRTDIIAIRSLSIAAEEFNSANAYGVFSSHRTG